MHIWCYIESFVPQMTIFFHLKSCFLLTNTSLAKLINLTGCHHLSIFLNSIIATFTYIYYSHFDEGKNKNLAKPDHCTYRWTSNLHTDNDYYVARKQNTIITRYFKLIQEFQIRLKMKAAMNECKCHILHHWTLWS